MIKLIKIGNVIHTNYDLQEDTQGLRDLPIDRIKEYALDTLNWQAGNAVKQSTGGTAIDLAAANSKAIALILKLIKPSDTAIGKLTDREQGIVRSLLGLGQNGYGDSDKLAASVESVATVVAQTASHAERIAQASTLDDVVAILNGE